VTATGAASIYDQLFRSFGLRENPFHVSPDPRFLFSGPAYENALAEMMFGIEAHRGLLVLSGEAGTGKTTLVRHFLQWLKDRQYSSSYVFHTHLDPAEMFELILRDFGVSVESTKKTELLATLHRWLQMRQSEGDTPVLIIDEAQALSLRTLGELSLLLNLENTKGKLLQILLVGQPELDEKLRRPELVAVRQRIMVRCRLPLLSLEETEQYIASRLRGAGSAEAKTFPPETIQTIYSYARGIPRVVNLLCEHALIGAYADRQTSVAPVHVRKVAAEFDLIGEPFGSDQFDLPMARMSREVAAVTEPLKTEQHLAAAIPVESLPVSQFAAFEPPAQIDSPAPFPEGLVPVAAAPVAPAPVAELRTAVPVVVKPLDLPRTGDSPRIEPTTERFAVWKKHRPESAFHRYWRDVAESFARDMRLFYRSTAPQLATIAGRIPSSSSNFHRSFFGTLRDWLARPINPNGNRKPPASTPTRDSRH